METLPDFSRIISSPPFTFLVGKDHAKLTIQSGLARHVSRPLDHLMNNGQTRESKHRITVLEDEEVEVFSAFTEYAYTGDYTVPVEKKEQPEQPAQPPTPSPPQLQPRPQTEAVSVSPLKHRALRALSTASFLPPPAPTPPPVDRPESKMLPQQEEPLMIEWENPFEGSIAQQQNSPAGPASNTPADETVEDSLLDSKDEPLLFPPRKLSKKDRKKTKKASATLFEETAAPVSLTPPSTPPFQHKDVKPEIDTDNNDADRDCAIETDPGDDIPPNASDWWDRPLSPGAEHPRHGYPRRPLHSASMIDTSFATQGISAPRKKGVSSWDEFADLEYFHQPSKPPVTSQPDVPYILFHAKLYVFATKYLISGLAQLCLKKLHRELLDYSLIPPSENEEGDLDETEANRFDAHARMFLDVLRYTYHKTNRFEPECQTSATLLRESELRKLVAQYAACKMRELALYSPAAIPVPSSPSHGPGSGVSVIAAPGGGLRELLDGIPELASDLVFRMM
ncbi:hypothetical protein BGW36DRAFT_395960 [Talaromyces proteolyticus]|uniref:BTB domain-containing protein n=1 Tax=Talaromyces proteolyticus TaxID=1131652 RepID=A0AAD4KW06_9EURO|nr:uncharacterized protein BGW36DRAFT_395960 [Talaromyces proteolyticus]KAH8701020.1 hypothetical protein BGW36DRAFT_395960 [Talaromyces proteolyticus]